MAALLEYLYLLALDIGQADLFQMGFSETLGNHPRYAPVTAQRLLHRLSFQ